MLSSLDRKQLRKFKTKKWREQRWVEVTKSLDWSMHLFTEIIGLACDKQVIKFVCTFLPDHEFKVTSDSEIFKSLWHLFSAFFYWSTFLCRINHQYPWYKIFIVVVYLIVMHQVFHKTKALRKYAGPTANVFFLLIIFKSVATLHGRSYSRPCKRAQSGKCCSCCKLPRGMQYTLTTPRNPDRKSLLHGRLVGAK